MSDDIARRLQITTESINTGATFVVDSEKYMLHHQIYSAKVLITGLERQAWPMARSARNWKRKLPRLHDFVFCLRTRSKKRMVGTLKIMVA